MQPPRREEKPEKPSRSGFGVHFRTPPYTSVHLKLKFGLPAIFGGIEVDKGGDGLPDIQCSSSMIDSPKKHDKMWRRAISGRTKPWG